MQENDCATMGNANCAEAPNMAGHWELQDIAGHYGVAPRTVQRWVSTGQCPRPLRMGRKRLWMPSQVMEWMERKCREAQTTAAAVNIGNFMVPDRPRRRRE